jgi:putative transposase
MLPQLILTALAGFVEGQQHQTIQYLREENRILKGQLHGRRLRLTDDERRRLAVLGKRLGRQVLTQVATLVPLDTIVRWHRELIARKWTYPSRRPGRPGILQDIRRLVVRMARENPGWGYTRIQSALKNLGHRVNVQIALRLLDDGMAEHSPTVKRVIICLADQAANGHPHRQRGCSQPL